MLLIEGSLAFVTVTVGAFDFAIVFVVVVTVLTGLFVFDSLFELDSLFVLGSSDSTTVGAVGRF